MASRYMNGAVNALYDFISHANFLEYLRAIEEEETLDTGYLPDPVAINKASAPFDNRSPKIDIFYEGASMYNRALGGMTVDCVIELQMLSPDVDFIQAQYDLALYSQAIWDAIIDNGTLTGAVVDCYIDNMSAAAGSGDKSHMILVNRFDLSVRVQTLKPL